MSKRSAKLALHKALDQYTLPEHIDSRFLIEMMSSPEIRSKLLNYLIQKEQEELPCRELAGGIDVPEYLIDDLSKFVDGWPGAIFPGAIPGTAVTVLHAFMNGPK